MNGPRAAGMGLLLGLLAFVAGCTPTGLPALLQGLPGPSETGSLAAPAGRYETSVTVSGTPTQVYARVGRGVLGCWFGAGGPLKGSHVFRAQAEPPSMGGAASIVIHERDAASPDQRGTLSYRIGFAGLGVLVRADVSALKFEQPVAAVMAKDVATWAKGGTGCQLRGFPALQASVDGIASKGRAAVKKR